LRKITVIWLIFVIIFLALGIFHLIQSKKEIEHFEIRGFYIDHIDGFPTSTGFENFVEDFNIYIDDLNIKNKNQNRISSLGYFAACLTALFSLILSRKNL